MAHEWPVRGKLPVTVALGVGELLAASFFVSLPDDEDPLWTDSPVGWIVGRRLPVSANMMSPARLIVEAQANMTVFLRSWRAASQYSGTRGVLLFFPFHYFGPWPGV